MYFQDLPERLLKPIYDLNFDKEWQKIYAEDPELDRLTSQQFDASKMLSEWLCFRDIPLRIGKHDWKNMTLEQLCTLYALENPIVKPHTAEVKEIDVCVFCYVTQCSSFDPKRLSFLVADAQEWFTKEAIDMEEASGAVQKLVKFAFQPLDFFPPTNDLIDNSGKIRFDCDWCASMISIVHQMTGLLPEQILRMPVAACGWYYLQYARQNGQNGLERKSNAEIIMLMDFRTNYLLAKRLADKKIVTEDEVPYLEELFKAPKFRKRNFELKEPRGDFAGFYKNLNKKKSHK